MNHGQECSHCYYIGEDHCGHDHFICHKQPEYPVLVRVGPSHWPPHATSLQTYLKCRDLDEDWARSVITVHGSGMMLLENLMGCRIGASRKKFWDVRDPRLCNGRDPVVW